MTSKWALWSGIAWSVLFALMSFYWAMGGMIGIRSLGGVIYEIALARDPEFIPIVWLTGWIKIWGAIFLLLLFKKWSSRGVNLVLYWVVVLGGACLFIYGALNFATISLAALGWLEMELDSYAIKMRLLFWEPFWMLGGVLYLLSARTFGSSLRRASSHRI